MILVFYQYAYIGAVIVDIFNEYAYICIFKYNRGLYMIKYANKYKLYIYFGDPYIYYHLHLIISKTYRSLKLIYYEVYN